VKILHFAGTYYPVPGGTTTRISNMIADSANEHLLIVPRPNERQYPTYTDNLKNEETQGHIHIRRVALSPTARQMGRLPYYGNRLLARTMISRAHGEEVDIIHGHNPRASALASLRFKQLHNLPMLYEAHGIMHDQVFFQSSSKPSTPITHISSWLSQKTAANLERGVISASDAVVVQTLSARHRLMELYDLKNKPVEVIPNGVDPDKFDPHRWETERETLRRKFGWGDKTVCLYAGYLDVVNGIDFLLDALPELSSKAAGKLKIVVLGRGPLQQKVEQAANDHKGLFEFAGIVEYNQMPSYYAASDIFVIPRPPLAPGELLLPMKLLEAMAMSKTVLVSNVAAMAEVVQDNLNGIVFNKGDMDDFIARLEYLAKQPAGLTGLGQQARQSVLKQYTWEKSRNKLQLIYEELVKGKRSPR
jgi:glycosyltransferase involved in cell wall biosynthesis